MLPIINSNTFSHSPSSEKIIYLLFYLYILTGSYFFAYNYFYEVGDDNANASASDKSSDNISPYPKVEYTDKYDITYLIEKGNLDQHDDLDIKRLEDCIVLENTPVGMIYMIYKDNEFGYYSNTNVNYNILDTVCRKFVKTFQCVSLYNKLEEHDKKNNKTDDKTDNLTSNETNTNTNTNTNTTNKKKKSHLFANFKKPNAPKTIKKNMNVFRKLGSLQEFKILKNTSSKKIHSIKNITFADFKNMN